MIVDGAKPVSFISVHDRAAGRAFYEGVLGLRHLSSDNFGDFYEMGDGFLRMTPMPDFQASPHSVLGWDVPDIEAAVNLLSGKGIVFNVYDGMGQAADGIWTSPEGAARVAWFNDPFGNVLSLSQH